MQASLDWPYLLILLTKQSAAELVHLHLLEAGLLEGYRVLQQLIRVAGASVLLLHGQLLVELVYVVALIVGFALVLEQQHVEVVVRLKGRRSSLAGHHLLLHVLEGSLVALA